MATSVDIVVNVVTKLKDSGVKEAEGKFGKMGSGLKKAMVPAIAATGAILAFGASAAKSASRVEQAMGAVDSVFGKNASQVKNWAADSADSVGLAKAEYMELASVLGAQLKNMGVPMDQIAGKTNELVTLGADLAATFGGTTAEAVDALGAMMRGETDPIEKYGVSIKQADIAARMAADGTDKLKGEQLKAAKTQAMLALLTEQTADAQGQFARESDTAAVAQQKAAAHYEDAKAALGEALLPAITKVMGALSKFAAWAQKNPTVIQAVIVVVLALAAAVIVLNVAMLILSANPVVLIIAGIVAVVLLLVAAITYAYKESQTFRNIVNAVWAGVSAAATNAGKTIAAVWRTIWNVGKAVFKWIRRNWQYLLAAMLFGPFGIAVVAIVKNFGKIRNAASILLAWIRAAFKNAWTAVKTTVQNAVGKIKDYVAGIKTTASNVVTYLTGKFSDAWGTVKTAADKAMEAITDPIGTIKSGLDSIIDKVQSLVSWLGKIKIPDLGKLGGLIGKVTGRSAMAPVPETPTGLAARTALGTTTTPRVSRAALAAPAAAGGNTYITVTGALDPEAVARQIKRLMSSHDRRIGVRVA